MPETPPNNHSPRGVSRILVFVMLGVIILSIAAFVAYRSDPRSAGRTPTDITSGH